MYGWTSVRAAARVRPGSLAWARKDIQPAFLERPLQHARVLRTERRQRRDHLFLGLLWRVGQVHGTDERRVEIVVVQLGEAHHPLSQLQVAVEGRQRTIDAFDEARVDRNRNVRAIEHHLERRWILPRFREERHLLHFAVHRRSERAAEASERLEERRHHLLTVVAVRQAAEDAERGRVELGCFPVAERDRRIRKVGVGQDVVDTRRRGGQRTGGGENPLLRIAQRVRRAARDVLEIEPMNLETRFRGDEFLERRPGGFQNLGFDV